MTHRDPCQDTGSISICCGVGRHAAQPDLGHGSVPIVRLSNVVRLYGVTLLEYVWNVVLNLVYREILHWLFNSCLNIALERCG
jgi:hypothetical protein